MRLLGKAALALLAPQQLFLDQVAAAPSNSEDLGARLARLAQAERALAASLAPRIVNAPFGEPRTQPIDGTVIRGMTSLPRVHDHVTAGSRQDMLLATMPAAPAASGPGSAPLPPSTYTTAGKNVAMNGKASTGTSKVAADSPAGTRGVPRQRVAKGSRAGLKPAAYLWLSVSPNSKGKPGGGTCKPECSAAHGICVNNVCLCKHPYEGDACEGTIEEEGGDEPLAKELAEGGVAEAWFGESGAKTLRDRVSIPLAVFIWSSLFVLTCICTSACPVLCAARRGGLPQVQAGAKGWLGGDAYEQCEAQHDIVEAWALDGRRRFERDNETESDRRAWFEKVVGDKLKGFPGKGGWYVNK